MGACDPVVAKTTKGKGETEDPLIQRCQVNPGKF